jgi:hypothetical protein
MSDRTSTAAAAPIGHRAPVRRGLFAVLLVPWLCGYWHVAHGAAPRVFPDTEQMQSLAALPLRFPDAFLGDKPIAYPLLLRLVGDDLAWLAALQTGLYFVAWGSLLYLMVFRPKHLAVAAGLGLATIGLALYPEFASWNHILLSESIALSSTVLTATCTFLAWERRRPRVVAAWVGLLVFGTLVRDFGAYYGLALLPMLVCWRMAGRLANVGLIAGALVLVLNFVASSWCADHGGRLAIRGRWAFGMVNNVAQRVLPDPELRAWFVARGMPWHDTLEALSGQWAHSRDAAFYHDPALAEFRRWIVADSKAVYARALLTHPGHVLAIVDRQWEEVTQWNHYINGFYPDAGYDKAPLVRVEHKWLHAANWLLLAALLVRALRRRERSTTWVVVAAAGYYACAWPLGLFAQFADAMEVGRHCLPMSLQNVLALAFSTLVLVGLGREAPAAAAATAGTAAPAPA